MGNCCGSTAIVPSSSPIPLQATPAREVPPRVVPPTTRPHEHRRLTPTVRRVLPDKIRFRILVVGKSRSEKSLFVDTVFRSDMPTGPEHVPGKADVDAGIVPHDDRHLVVHECPDFESGCDQNNLNNSEFIERRTGENFSTSERLHAIWVCVPMSDVIAKNLGDGVEEILSLNGVVPVILVATKFDLVASKVLFDIAGGDARLYERARGTAYAKYEESCRSLYRVKLRDVPRSRDMMISLKD